MLGSFLTRGLVLIFGYAFPAYECYKTVEKNKPELEQLRFWCQYWILVAMLTVCERIGDTFVSWLPMYSEAKLAFYIFLWYPKTKGTTYVYDSFFKPYVSKHEMEIDRNLLELRTRAGDMLVLYCQKAASYGQTRIFEVLQYVAVQSSSVARSNQNQPEQQAPKAAARQPAGAPRRQPPVRPPPPVEEPPSPTSSTSSTQHQREVEQEVTSSPRAPSPAPAPLNPPRRLLSAPVQNPPRRLLSAPPNTTQSSPKKTPHPSNPETPNLPPLKKATSVPPETTVQTLPKPDSMEIDPIPPQQDNPPPSAPPVETRMEETIRITRNRLRKARSATEK